MSVKVTLGKYELGGGMGCWARSFENNVDVGEVRVIGEVLMHSRYVYRRKWSKNEISWVPVDDKLNGFSQLKDWIRNQI